MAIAKYATTCSNPACRRAVSPGSAVRFDRDAGGRLVVTQCPACAPGARPGAQAASQEGAPTQGALALRVKIQRQTWLAPERDFTVAEAVVDESTPLPEGSPKFRGLTMTVKGRLGEVVPGDVLDLRGGFAEDAKGRGPFFKVSSAVPVLAGTDAALKAFLQHFPEVGPVRAEQLLHEIGGRKEVLAVLDAGNAAALTVVPGITLARAEAICREYTAKRDLRDAQLYLAELDLSDELQAKVIDRWRGEAKKVLTENPYALLELSGTNFFKVDTIARRAGIVEDDPRRLRALLLFLLEKAADQGHTYSTVDQLALLS